MKVKISKSNSLNGTVIISGSKNAALPLIACSLLTKEEVILTNVPWITDVVNLIKILVKMNVSVKYYAKTKTLKMKRRHLPIHLKYLEITKFRASYYLMGALINNKKHFTILYPGGCDLGKRPIDYHIKAFNILGYHVKAKKTHLRFTKKLLCNNKKHIKISFASVSVGATINTILASIKRKSITTILNPSLEPEVIAVVEMLNLMGANIIVKESSIDIYGTKKLFGVTYRVPFDRIEAGSFMILASLIPKSIVRIKNINPLYLTEVINILRKMNVKVHVKTHMLIIEAPSEIKAINLIVTPYPGFPTDLQQIISILMLRGNDSSTITDSLYPMRISPIYYSTYNNGMIEIINKEIKVNPPLTFDKKNLTIPARDLRGGFSLICLALLKKKLIIDDFEIIKRGYENIERKLELLEIDVKKY